MTHYRSMDLDRITTWLGHSLSGVAVLGSMLGWFPQFAAAVAVIFYGIEIYEKKTVQDWIAARRARKIAKLKARTMKLEERQARQKVDK